MSNWLITFWSLALGAGLYAVGFYRGFNKGRDFQRELMERPYRGGRIEGQQTRVD